MRPDTARPSARPWGLDLRMIFAVGDSNMSLDPFTERCDWRVEPGCLQSNTRSLWRLPGRQHAAPVGRGRLGAQVKEREPRRRQNLRAEIQAESHDHG